LFHGPVLQLLLGQRLELSFLNELTLELGNTKSGRKERACWKTNFTSFLTLLVVNVIVAGVYHWILRYRFLEGVESFLAKVAVGWVGGPLGSSVLGHWLWKIQRVYLVPAILGAISAIHLNVLCWKAASAKLFGAGLGAVEEIRWKPAA
jgi:uncharacterized membrane protein YeaQ/YmgE (transglycosylase-associated protein family)